MAEVPTSQVVGPPLTVEEVLAAADMRFGADGKPSVVWLRTDAEAADPKEQEVTRKLVPAAGHVAFRVHGRGGKMHVGGREITPEVFGQARRALGLADRPFHLVMCAAGVFAQHPVDDAAAGEVRALASPDTVLISTDTGLVYASRTPRKLDGETLVFEPGAAGSDRRRLAPGPDGAMEDAWPRVAQRPPRRDLGVGWYLPDGGQLGDLAQLRLVPVQTGATGNCFYTALIRTLGGALPTQARTVRGLRRWLAPAAASAKTDFDVDPDDFLPPGHQALMTARERRSLLELINAKDQKKIKKRVKAALEAGKEIGRENLGVDVFKKAPARE